MVDGAGPFVQHRQVGERSADIEPDSIHDDQAAVPGAAHRLRMIFTLSFAARLESLG